MYTASLRSAVAALPVRRAVTSGWSARSFTGAHPTRVVRTVPLAEAWASGGRTWTAARRLAFADDRLNTGSLRTASSRARADRDAAGWLPARRCSYIAAWTSVKLRWRLAVDRAEATALRRVALQCPATQVTVVRT